jgi:hypothetical protein
MSNVTEANSLYSPNLLAALSLRLGSAAARLLGLRARIPPGTYTSVVSIVFCQEKVSEWG